ncbi:hypothetical protein AAG906_023747 [Vitis piasezkii]
MVFSCSLGTTLVALRYYLSGLVGPPMVFAHCSLGTTLVAFSPQVVHQWFLLCCLGTTLMAFSLGTTLRALRYYLSGLEVHPYTYRNENQFLHFNFHQDPYELMDSSHISLAASMTFRNGPLLSLKMMVMMMAMLLNCCIRLQL